MSINRAFVFAFLILCLLESAWAEKRQELTWEDMGSVIGKSVRIVMPEGAVLEGIATAVEPESLVLKVRKTNGDAHYSKGPLNIPRASLKTLQVGNPTIRWRITGVAAGSAIGVIAVACGVEAASNVALFGGYKEPAKGTAAGFYGAAIALPVGGYFIGKAADRRWTTVVIVP